jgi:hypothetical protein
MAMIPTSKASNVVNIDASPRDFSTIPQPTVAVVPSKATFDILRVACKRPGVRYDNAALKTLCPPLALFMQ